MVQAAVPAGRDVNEPILYIRATRPRWRGILLITGICVVAWMIVGYWTDAEYQATQLQSRLSRQEQVIAEQDSLIRTLCYEIRLTQVRTGLLPATMCPQAVRRHDRPASRTSSHVYRLYRSSVMDSARIHVASFDTPGSASYNQQNCEIAAARFRTQPGVVVRYWCEQALPR